MEKKNNLNSRKEDENSEKEVVVESNVPDTKFQQNQQIQKPIEQGAAADVKENPFTAKKQNSNGSQLKQEAVAKVITGTGGSMPGEGIASPSRAGLRTLVYSGNEGTILGNPSGTPVVGSPSRSDTRPGQKLDAVAKAIDFIASEQVYQDVRGSVPLQDNPTEVQGFLGHPENNNARLQKIAEAVPGALMYARSCDEIKRDEIAFVEGQHVKQEGIDAKVSPTLTFVPDPSARDLGSNYKSYDNVRGNYIPKTMHIGVSSNGSIVSMSFDVDEIDSTRSADVVNKSSSAWIRSMNIDEINRQNMESKAGIETEKNWCPLVRAVGQPTQTIGYLTDDEITVGSELFMSYRFANKAHSYFFNKAAKDGQTPYRSFKEMLKGNSVHTRTSQEYDNNMVNFDAADYVNGAPSLMIALYDSIAKYSKRGDLLTQPRSWKMHLQTADNNINPFKIHPVLGRYMKGRDVFSTIDRGYDPLLPVNISDNWRLSHVLNFNKLLNTATAQIVEFKLGGKGAMVAGTAFNNIYDAINNNSHVIKHQMQKYSSGSASGHSIYQDYGYKNSMRYDDSVITMCAGDKTGFTTQLEGRAAALELLSSVNMRGNNAQLKPIVILYKVPDTGADDVYAICRYPNIINLNATTVNAKLFVSYDTTADYMSSDTGTNIVILDTVYLQNDIFTYKYQNRQNPYVVAVKNPLLFGIYEWATNLGAKLASPSVSAGATNPSNLRDTQGILWYHVPIVHSTTSISLWDLIVCASVPFMQKIRTNSQFDTLNYEELNGSYPFAQLTSISEANPLASDNYQMVDRLKPLVVGTMKAATAITWIMPEKFWRVKHTLSSGSISTETFVLPFYFSHEGFANKPNASTTTIFARLEDGNVMNFPSTRSGARSAFVDHFYDMTERDIRLCLDMMIEAPRKDDISYAPVSEGVYRYGLSNSGVPVITYSNANGSLDVISYLKTPRELGLGMVAPAGYNSPCDSKYYASNRVNFTDYSDDTTLISLGSSYSVRTWHVAGGQYAGLHAGSSLIIERGGNFAQDWARRDDAIYAHADNTNTENYGALVAAANIGISLNFNDAMEVDTNKIVGQDNTSLFKPYTYDGNTSNTNLPKLITLQNVLWPRVQILPFALSPFDQTPEGRDNSGTEKTVDMTADPYDFMYIFGFAGYKASDYREDVYNRITEKDTLGWTFTTDPFVEASPVLK